MTASQFIVTGTDTGVGKTIVSAMLVQALQAVYYKPVQAGLDEETDTETVRRLTDLPDSHFLEEMYRLQTPASPHLSAEIDGIEIDFDRLKSVPEISHPLIIEGAGGALVPLTGRRGQLFADLFRVWRRPVIVCARTTLGTINHTLTTVLTLEHYEVPVHGIVFVGDAHRSNESAITHLSGVRRLGRLPRLPVLTSESLKLAFEEYFSPDQF